MSAQLVPEITFEEGYAELKRIVERLDDEDISVHEMCQQFARGKGLEKVLREYLETQVGKVDAIEAGEGLPDFSIVAPGGAREEPVQKPQSAPEEPDTQEEPDTPEEPVRREEPLLEEVVDGPILEEVAEDWPPAA